MAISVDEPHVSHDEKVRTRAYYIWLERIVNDRPGNAETDWHIAELELEHADQGQE